MSLVSAFGNNRKNEAEGVWFLLTDTTRVRLKRSGGGNAAYEENWRQRLKPYRRRLQTQGVDAMPTSRMQEITIACFVDTVISGWQTSINEQWCDGIEPYEMKDDGPVPKDYAAAEDLLPVNAENLKKVLADFPDAFKFIVDICDDASAFREGLLEEDTKNS